MTRTEGPAGFSYSIHFIANMICLNGEAKAKTFLCGQPPPPPLATTNSHGTVSPLRQTFSYKSSSPAWIKPNASRLNVAVSLEGRHMCSQFGLRKSCKWNLPDLVRPSANHKTLLLQNVFYAHSTKVQRHRFKYLISFYFSSGFICYSAQQHTGNCGKI